MVSDNQEVIYCADDDEYITYRHICNKPRIDRYYKNHLELGTHIDIVHKKTTIKEHKEKYLNLFVSIKVIVCHEDT